MPVSQSFKPFYQPRTWLEEWSVTYTLTTGNRCYALDVYRIGGNYFVYRLEDLCTEDYPPDVFTTQAFLAAIHIIETDTQYARSYSSCSLPCLKTDPEEKIAADLVDYILGTSYRQSAELEEA